MKQSSMLVCGKVKIHGSYWDTLELQNSKQIEERLMEKKNGGSANASGLEKGGWYGKFLFLGKETGNHD